MRPPAPFRPSRLTAAMFLFVLLGFSALAAKPCYQPPASPRATYNFKPGWKFLREDAPGAEAVNFDDRAWASVGGRRGAAPAATPAWPAPM